VQGSFFYLINSFWVLKLFQGITMWHNSPKRLHGASSATSRDQRGGERGRFQQWTGSPPHILPRDRGTAHPLQFPVTQNTGQQAEAAK